MRINLTISSLNDNHNTLKNQVFCDLLDIFEGIGEVIVERNRMYFRPPRFIIPEV